MLRSSTSAFPPLLATPLVPLYSVRGPADIFGVGDEDLVSDAGFGCLGHCAVSYDDDDDDDDKQDDITQALLAR